MMIIQSGPSDPSNPSAIESTAAVERGWFRGYFLWLLISAVVTAFLSFFVWRANNAHHKEVMTEYNARIAEATQRIKELENKNLLLQRDLMLLQLEGTDPNRSKAEFDSHWGEFMRQFGNLVEGGPAMPRAPNISHRSVGPQTQRRRLSDEGKRRIVEVLGTDAKGTIEIVCAVDKILKDEPSEYALELTEALKSAGWTVNNSGEADIISPLMPALTLYIGNQDEYTQDSALFKTVWALRIHPTVQQNDLRRGQVPLLLVGLLH